MANRLVKRGRTTYVPAVASRAAVPAYCVVTRAPTQSQPQKAGFRDGGPRTSYSSGSTSTGNGLTNYQTNNQNYGYYGLPVRNTGNINPLTGMPEVEVVPGINVPVPIPNPTIAQVPPSVTTYYEGGTVCYPAIPGVQGTPAYYIDESIQGWNGGARSIDFFTGDGFVLFKFAARPVGVIAGFVNEDLSSSFAEATHAVYATSSSIHIVERGQVVASSPVEPDTEPTILIVRRNANVTYYVGSWQYRSAVQSSGPIYLDASLYTTGDFVDTPNIGPIANLPPNLLVVMSGGGALPMLAGQGGDAYSQGGGVLPMITGEGSLEDSVYLYGGGALPMLVGYGADRPYTTGEGVLPMITGSGSIGFPAPAISVGGGVVPMIVGTGLMYAGVLLSGGGTLPALIGYGADRPYAEGGGTLPMIVGYGDDGPEPGTYGTMQFLYASDYFIPSPTMFAVIEESLQFGTTMTIVMLQADGFVDTLNLGDTFTPSYVMLDAINTALGLNSSVSTSKLAALQYAVSAIGGALSVYENFDFTAFATTRFGGYASRADGVYKLGYTTDNGDLIRAAIDFGADDFETSNKKYFGHIYVGVDTDGEVFLRLVDDLDNSYVYRVEGEAPTMRVTPAKGAASKEWRVQLEVVDASTVELSAIDFQVALSTRRIIRGR